MKKHITLFAALLLIFALVLSACSGAETGSEDEEPFSEPTVTENDDNTAEQSGEDKAELPEPSEEEENRTPDAPERAEEAEPLPEPDAFDHEVTQPGPGGDTADGGPQAASHIQSVAGVPLVRLNNGVYMPRFGLNFGLGREIAVAPIGDMDAGILVADDAHSLFHFFLLTGYDGNTLALLEGMA